MNKKFGHIGLDKYNLETVDIIHDLETPPLPFPDNSFNIIIASHILEHIVNFYPLMQDLHRILKPNGVLKVKVPCLGGFKMPDHKRFFSKDSFKEFRLDYSKNYTTKARFWIMKVKYNFIADGVKNNWRLLNIIFNPILNLWQGFSEKVIPHLIDEICIDLVAIK